MKFIKNLFKKSRDSDYKEGNKKFFVLSLDGVPFSFIRKLVDDHQLPVFADLMKKGQFQQLNSVIPTVSSVAWSSFMTGEDAAGHNIFGFIDREPDPFNIFIPTADRRKGETIWEHLDRLDKKSIVINVPVTYPPSPINGMLISGFLATDLDRATYPHSLVSKLDNIDYVIDVDTWIARESRQKFLRELNSVLEKRFEAMFSLLEEDWDYFHCHIMETDRINHFFWRDMSENHPVYRDAFIKFYQKIDDYLGKLLQRLDENTVLMILSDHGFCPVKKEVEINYWLETAGYLDYTTADPESLADMAAESRAYSLQPGRIFINLEGREEWGSVPQEKYDLLRQKLKQELLNLQDPDTGDKMIKEVFFREELYEGPYLERAADVIAVSVTGYDLKSRVNSEQLTTAGFIQGMHTFDDAFLYVYNYPEKEKLSDINNIKDVNHIIIDYFEEAE